MEGRKRVEDKNRNKEQGRATKQETVTNLVDVSPTMSIITLNISGLNAQIKRQRLVEWIKKQDSTMLSTGNPLKI